MKEEKKKAPTSAYDTGNNVFETRLVDPTSGGKVFLGSYGYETDSALAADLGIRRLGVNNYISSRKGPITNDHLFNDPYAAKLPTVRTAQTATEEDVARDNPRKSFNPESPSKKEAPTFRTLLRKLSSGSGEKKGSLASESRKVTPKSCQQSDNPNQAIFAIQGGQGTCIEQPIRIQNLGALPSSKGLPPNRWSPPPPGANRAATRHTKNYNKWKRDRRPGDRDTIQVEIWKSRQGVPYRPNQVAFRDAYWCPQRNQYCYTHPADYCAQIQEDQATKRLRTDLVESVDTAMQGPYQRLYRYKCSRGQA